jgi:enoyl-CoA hydratase
MAADILTEVREQIGLVRLNRPDALNALTQAMLEQIVQACERFDADPGIRCLLIAGSARAFAAGSDIAEQADASLVDMVQRNAGVWWERLKRIAKPIVAAVSGFAVGGGCELMMACDIIVAAESARIGQPEINAGVMPGAGGTQRLTRAIGKARAMDLVLTGRTIGAREALALGLVSRVVPREQYLDEALRICRELCDRPPVALRLAKEAVLKAHEMNLSEGLDYERRLFYMLFGTDDQKEGMRAFLEKRPAVFIGR